MTPSWGLICLGGGIGDGTLRFPWDNGNVGYSKGQPWGVQTWSLWKKWWKTYLFGGQCFWANWPIIPKPEFFGDFGKIPLLHHHLGWPRRFGRYNLPRCFHGVLERMVFFATAHGSVHIKRIQGTKEGYHQHFTTIKQEPKNPSGPTFWEKNPSEVWNQLQEDFLQRSFFDQTNPFSHHLMVTSECPSPGCDQWYSRACESSLQKNVREIAPGFHLSQLGAKALDFSEHHQFLDLFLQLKKRERERERNKKKHVLPAIVVYQQQLITQKLFFFRGPYILSRKVSHSPPHLVVPCSPTVPAGQLKLPQGFWSKRRQKRPTRSLERSGDKNRPTLVWISWEMAQNIPANGPKHPCKWPKTSLKKWCLENDDFRNWNGLLKRGGGNC